MHITPVMFVDPAGKTSELGPGMGGRGAIFNDPYDVIKYCKYICFYRGTRIVRHSVSGLSSWAIFQTIYLNDLEADPMTVQHEYGHIIQERDIGSFAYLVRIFTPSIIGCTLKVQNYYDQPWELTADIFGGVQNRPNYQYSFDEIERGMNQLKHGIPHTDREIVQFFTKIKRFFDRLIG